VALTQVERALLDAPELLQDQQLQRLAHQMAKPSTTPELIGLHSERMMFHDIVQRMYTDDGDGDGRLTPQAYRILGADAGTGGAVPPIAQLTMPVLTASRKEILSHYDAMIDQAEALLAQPRRDADWRPYYQQVEQWHDSPLSLMRYGLLSMFVPALSKAHDQTERYLARRDAVLTALALELYRRQTGSYPQSLEELSPALLPSVPVDRITGDPLRYRLVDGQPLLYSVGANRVDDGGVPALDHAGHPRVTIASRWDIAPENAPAGDWVLYPEPRVETWDEDEVE
jgi:hypothetical protein